MERTDMKYDPNNDAGNYNHDWNDKEYWNGYYAHQKVEADMATLTRYIKNFFITIAVLWGLFLVVGNPQLEAIVGAVYITIAICHYKWRE